MYFIGWGLLRYLELELWESNNYMKMDSVNQILKYQKILLRLYSRILKKDVDLTEDERIVYKNFEQEFWWNQLVKIAP